jgi:hypothetical protein
VQHLAEKTSDSNDDNDASIEPISVEVLSDTDKAIIEEAKKALVDSAETIKDFGRSMVTVVSGLFTVYFALLKFIGITSSKDIPNESIILLPPVLFIISLILFVMTILPLPGWLSLIFLSDIEKSRHQILIRRYVFVVAAVTFFVAALGIAAIVFYQRL